MKKQKIMVALAFSEYAQELLNYAYELAQSLNADLLVANVINQRDIEAVRTISSMGYDVDGEHYIQNIRTERSKTLDSLATKIGISKETLNAVVRVGNPTDELLKAIIQEEVDLVIMGVKAKSDIEHILVGSVAEKLFRRCPVPIISYRDSKTVQRLKKKIKPEH